MRDSNSSYGGARVDEMLPENLVAELMRKMTPPARSPRPRRAGAVGPGSSRSATIADGPLCLDVTFRFPMPKSRRKAIRDTGECPKVSAPDLDKLVRGVGDALKIGGLIRDDALIAEVSARKVEVVGWTGAVITITPLREEHP